MRKIKYIFTILFSFLISSNSSSDELNVLFLKLKNAENFSQAANLEKKNMEYLDNKWLKPKK